MDNTKLTELFVSHTEAVNTLWGFLSTIALGILVFLYKDGRPVGKMPLKLVLTIGFVLFAGGNCTAMYREQTILSAISKALISVPKTDAFYAVFVAHKAATPCQLFVTQIGMITSVIALIWIPSYIGKR